MGVTLGPAVWGAGTPAAQWFEGPGDTLPSWFCLGLGQGWLTTRGQCTLRRLSAQSPEGERARPP